MKPQQTPQSRTGKATKPAGRQPLRLDPSSLVWELKSVADPQIDPAGDRIVYLESVKDRASGSTIRHLWMMDRAGAGRRQLTFAGTMNFCPRWSPDGASLAFISNRGDEFGIYRLPFDGGDPVEVVTQAAPIGGLSWAPDGTAIAYTAEHDPNPAHEPDAGQPPSRPVRVTRRADFKQDGMGYLGDRRGQVWIVDLASGASRRLTQPPAEHVHPVWSPNGRALAVGVPSWNFHASQLALIDVATGNEHLIGDPLGAVGSYIWSLDGSSIVFAGEPRRTWQFDFFRYDIERDTIGRLTHDLPCQPFQSWSIFDPPTQPIWFDERRLLFPAARGGASGIYQLDVETGHVEEIERWDAQHIGFSIDAGARGIVQARTSFECTGEIVVFDRERGSTSQITDLNGTFLRARPPAGWEHIETSSGDAVVSSWLLKPPEFEPALRYPIVLDVHGGPNNWHGFELDPLAQSLAAAGLLVLSVNPRGSGSYGREFTQAVTGDWGGTDFQDLMLVLDTICDRPYVDSERTGLFGYSYGGYMTAWALSRTTRFRAAVCGAPVFDLESFYGTSDIGPLWGPQQWRGEPYRIREWCEARSPSSFAHLISTPTLIIHGEADERCPIGQSEQMFAILTAAGCDVEYVRYPGQDHGFPWQGDPVYVEDFLQRTVDWFRRYLLDGDPCVETSASAPRPTPSHPQSTG